METDVTENKTKGTMEAAIIQSSCFICGDLLPINSFPDQGTEDFVNCLSKLFRFPALTREELKVESGPKFCGKCLEILNNVMGTTREIEILENNLRAMKALIKEKMLSNSHGDNINSQEHAQRSALIHRLKEEESTSESDREVLPKKPYANLRDGCEAKQNSPLQRNACIELANNDEPSKAQVKSIRRSSRRTKPTARFLENSEENTEKFQCSFCSRLFRTENAKNAHSRVHRKNEKALTCSLCNDKFTSVEELKSHYLSVHKDFTNSSCPICGLQLQSERVPSNKERISDSEEMAIDTDFQEHLAKLWLEHLPICSVKAIPATATVGNSEDPNYECEKCHEYFKRRAQLRCHVARVHEKGSDTDPENVEDEPPHVEGQETEQLLETHVENRLKNFRCFYCPKSFATENARNGHGKIHANLKPFRCRLCGTGLGTFAKFKVHLVHKHPDADQSQCPLCGLNLMDCARNDEFYCEIDDCTESFDTLFKFRSHHLPKCACKVENSRGKNTLENNDRKFENPAEVLHHKGQDHSESGEFTEGNHITSKNPVPDVIINEEAPSALPSTSQSRSRVSRSDNDPLWRRKYYRRTASKSNLANFQPYRCKLCGERFAQLYGLKRHFKTHGKEAQSACPMCGLNFKSHRPPNSESGLRLFQCPLVKCCDRTFENISNLRAHHFLRCPENPKVKERIGVTKSKLVCDQCWKPFGNEEALMRHMVRAHSQEAGEVLKESDDDKSEEKEMEETKDPKIGQTLQGDYKCLHCRKRFPSEVSRNHHMKIHRISKPYSCKICGHRFTQIKNVRRHVIQVHRTSAQYTCHHCGEDFKLCVGDGDHQYKCRLFGCDQTFDSLSDLRSHHFLKCPENPAVKAITTAECSCDICGRLFSSDDYLRSHILNVHDKGDKGTDDAAWDSGPFKCPSCPKTFSTDAGMNKHKRIHPHGKSLSCKICQAEFTLAKSLRKHFVTCHVELAKSTCHYCGTDFMEDKDESGQFSCNLNYCERVFPSVDLLCDHHIQKCPLKPEKIPLEGYTCDRCGKSFAGSTALKDHIASIHDKTFKLYCEKCGRGFQKFCDLKRHTEFVHSNEKRFECEICKMRFKRSNQLFYHRRIHTGEKPFICEVCGKGFHIPGKLRLHVALHSAKKEFPCPECGKLFASKHYVTYHINFTHKRRSRTKHRKIVEDELPNNQIEQTIVIEFQQGPELEVHTEGLEFKPC